MTTSIVVPFRFALGQRVRWVYHPTWHFHIVWRQYLEGPVHQERTYGVVAEEGIGHHSYTAGEDALMPEDDAP